MTHYPCPSCRDEEREQTEIQLARVYVSPRTVALLQCPKHQGEIYAHVTETNIRTIPFVLEQPADTSELLTTLRLLVCAVNRYRNSETAVSLAMGEEAFQDDGSNPEFTAALEEQAEATKALNEALAIAGRVKESIGGIKTCQVR